MHFFDKLSIKFYHSDRLKEWGGNRAKVQGWHSIDSQQDRFEALCRPLDLTGKTVLDLGCGYGDLKRYLDQIPAKQNGSEHQGQIASYLGIDQHGMFIKSAKREFSSCVATRFIKADFSTITLPKADIIIASGSLNYRSRIKDYHQQLIKSMYSSARYAVAFNMLDSSCFRYDKLLVAHEPQLVLNFCRSICPGAELFDHYSNSDFTIIMKR